MTPAPPVARAQTVVAGWGLLTDGDPVTTAPVELDRVGSAELIAWAIRARMTGPLVDAIDAGRVRVDEGQRIVAHDAHLSALRTTLAAEAHAVDAAERLQRAGIRSRLLKGLAAAHLDYPDPAWRNCVDVDLLVDRSSLHRAIDVLTAAGCTRAEPPLARWWERRFARAVVLRSPGGTELDVHAAVATGYFGEALDHSLLLDAPPDAFDLGGVTVDALPGPARLLTSCYSAALGRGSGVRILRDIAQQLAVTHVDWQAAVGLAGGDGDAVLAQAFERTASQFPLLGTHPAVHWAGDVRPTPTARRALALAERAAAEGWAADARSTALALGPLERVRFYAGVVFPPRDHLRARGRTVAGHLRRGLRLLGRR